MLKWGTAQMQSEKGSDALTNLFCQIRSLQLHVRKHWQWLQLDFRLQRRWKKKSSISINFSESIMEYLNYSEQFLTFFLLFSLRNSYFVFAQALCKMRMKRACVIEKSWKVKDDG